MTLYTVSVPVSVETYARSPKEAVANAFRSIYTRPEWATRVRLAGEWILVRVSRPDLRSVTFYTHAGTMRAIKERRAWINLQDRATRDELDRCTRENEYLRARLERAMTVVDAAAALTDHDIMGSRDAMDSLVDAVADYRATMGKVPTETVRPMTVGQLGLCSLSDDPELGPDAARHKAGPA